MMNTRSSVTRYWPGALALYCFIVLSGCQSAPSAGIEKRLQRTKAMILRRISDEDRPMGNILMALNRTNRQTLETAEVCDARFFYTYAGNPNNSLLAIYWLQDYPSADGVRLLWTDGTQKEFSIFADAKSENEKDATEVVVYNASFPVAHGSRDAKELETKPEPTLVLLKDGSVISRPARVRWIFNGEKAEWGSKGG
jgi:hypothetical protein